MAALLGAIALAISVAGGPNPATPAGENSPQAANFSAPPGSDPVPVLTAGELTIEAGCTQTTNGPSLTVFATTSAEKATIVSALRRTRITGHLVEQIDHAI